MKIKMFDTIESLIDRDPIKKGDNGTVVEVWGESGPYEVEFLDQKTGNTIALLTMLDSEIKITDDFD